LAMWTAAADAHVVVANQVVHFIYVLISGHSASPVLFEQQASLPSGQSTLQLSVVDVACCSGCADVSNGRSRRYRIRSVDQAACGQRWAYASDA
jgi:hypothetical protein